jgi:hypothetical protein
MVLVIGCGCRALAYLAASRRLYDRVFVPFVAGRALNGLSATAWRTPAASRVGANLCLCRHVRLGFIGCGTLCGNSLRISRRIHSAPACASLPFHDPHFLLADSSRGFHGFHCIHRRRDCLLCLSTPAKNIAGGYSRTWRRLLRLAAHLVPVAMVPALGSAFSPRLFAFHWRSAVVVCGDTGGSLWVDAPALAAGRSARPRNTTWILV